MKQRIEYFDTAKGLLMFFLIWGHMIIFAKTLGIESEFTQTIQNTVPFYRAFFMQTFFFITGFCTSWHTPFRSFLVKNFKTIILPAFIFLPFAYLTNEIIGREAGLNAFTGICLSYLTSGIPWFLAALFISKIIYLAISEATQNLLLKWLLIAVVFSIGLFIKESTSLPNNWSYQHAMLMLPFLALGSLAKTINTEGVKVLKFTIGGGGNLLTSKYLIIISLPYFGIILLWQILGLGLGFPAVDSYLDIHYITAPFHLALAVSGTALIFLIAQQLQSVGFIKVIGRQSLFVYLFHTFVVFGLMKTTLVLNIPASTYYNGMIFFLSIYMLSFVILYIGCRLMESKYLSWMVGKF